MDLTGRVPAFDRRFLSREKRITRIGDGELGGKGEGLLQAAEALGKRFDAAAFPGVDVDVPAMAVLGTGVFDAFLDRNGFRGLEGANLRDDQIAHEFQRGELPTEILGDLRALVEEVRLPVAVRSSSLLEDALGAPMAGVYETKMTPNNQPDPSVRFKVLTEAVKYVYASTFFAAARDYRRALGREATGEKMAVVLQEVVGTRRDDRYYPHLSGVARSFNFYPIPGARPKDGVISLALGLGKTIVDGGVCWFYSPARPTAPPPFAGTGDLLRNTQTAFWAVNMGRPPAFDPVAEAEYLIKAGLAEAEQDGMLNYLASTYLPESDRLVPGTGRSGPRVIDFSPLLKLNEWPLNALVRHLMALFEETLRAEIEIEFALTLPDFGKDGRPRLGFLQVRPLNVSSEEMSVSEDELEGDGVLASSRAVMGNGSVEGVRDIVYVRPERFETRRTPEIAAELEVLNRGLADQGRPYLLIGFGRWGSSEPWLGVPVAWGQISSARAIVEATREGIDVEPSQGSHFFHNLSSFRVGYFFIHHASGPPVDWAWLDRQPAAAETELLRHIRLTDPLDIRLDGRAGRGVIRYAHGD